MGWENKGAPPTDHAGGDDPARGVWVFDRETGQAELIVAVGANAIGYPFQAISPRGDRLRISSLTAARFA